MTYQDLASCRASGRYWRRRALEARKCPTSSSAGPLTDVNEAILPRSTPFPHSPHAMSRSDAACREAFPGLWVPVPTARANGGSRPTCCANGVCRLCPVDAKFTVFNGIDRFTRAGVRLLTGAEVR